MNTILLKRTVSKPFITIIKDRFDIQDREPVSRRHVYEILTDDYEEWQELFNKVQQEILSGKVKKVVISREVKIECESIISIESVLKNLL